MKILLQKCSDGRLDLGESRKSDTVRSRDLPRLLECACKLDLIEPHMLWPALSDVAQCRSDHLRFGALFCVRADAAMLRD